MTSSSKQNRQMAEKKEKQKNQFFKKNRWKMQTYINP